MQRVGVERLHVHGPAGCDERLADHLAAEHALPANLRTAAAKQVVLKLFEIEDGKQIVNGVGHSSSSGCDLNGYRAGSGSAAVHGQADAGDEPLQRRLTAHRTRTSPFA
jgi:hypothetical protein